MQAHAIRICLWSVIGPGSLVWNLRNVSVFFCLWKLHEIIDQLDLIDIYRTLHPQKNPEYTFFSSTHGMFSSIDSIKWVKLLSRVQLFATPWTVAHQAPLSMGSSRQEYWSGLPFPSPGDLPNPGIEPGSPALQADALSSEPPGKHTRSRNKPQQI